MNFIWEPINSNISAVKHSGGRLGFNDEVGIGPEASWLSALLLLVSKSKL
jgi:hypothetical protein